MRMKRKTKMKRQNCNNKHTYSIHLNLSLFQFMLASLSVYARYLVCVYVSLHEYYSYVPSCSAFAFSNLVHPRKTFSSDLARDIINENLFPVTEYAERMRVGKNDQFPGQEPISVDANDHRLTLTYHEFPLRSFDTLLELAMREYELSNDTEDDEERAKAKVLVDIGSGCGRIVLYSSLLEEENQNGSEPQSRSKWKEVHGIEIGSQMHDYAVETLRKGVQIGHFYDATISCNDDDDDNNDNDDDSPSSSCSVHFHEGPAEEKEDVLHKADVIFCYSTVFESGGFNEELGAMVLAEDWSKMLSSVCKDGTVVITTDRALDPAHGWELRQSLEVENPSLLGSQGYVSILQKQRAKG